MGALYLMLSAPSPYLGRDLTSALAVAIRTACARLPSSGGKQVRRDDWRGRICGYSMGSFYKQTHRLAEVAALHSHIIETNVVSIARGD